MKGSRYRGFTIWELLVVLGVLFIVAAILFPMFARPTYPKRLSCMSNMKQIGLGLNMYVQDYDQAFPATGRSDVAEDNGWAIALQPYTKSTQIFSCPVDRSFSSEDSVSKTHYTNYYFNAKLEKKLFSKIRSVETVLSLGEGVAASSNYSCHSFDLCIGLTDAGPVGPLPQDGKARHFDGSNYAFADGHVKWLKPGQVKMRPGKNVRASFEFVARSN